MKKALVGALAAFSLAAAEIPREVPRRRSTQLADGFGMNIALPREPRMPWTKTWTPLFDAGVKWVRIGQYENSSERTSWDWVEQTPGRLEISPEVDEAVRSLADNGVRVEIQLQYSNPLYQGEPGRRAQRVTLPPPGIGPGDKPPNAIFNPPKTDEQIEAFLRYVRFMVNRYKSTVKHWELWNEPNIGYWQPDTKTKEKLAEKGRWYGRVLSRFADAIHETDPESKVMFGGISSPDAVFAEAALAECASKIDVVAYHTYPGFGTNHMPEEADTLLGASEFRERIQHLAGARHDLEFWLNEWNVSPKWKESNETVQARYVPRFFLYAHAQGIRGFMWTFIPSTDGNEADMYGIRHGETFGPDAFQPRPALRGFEATSALFGQTRADPLAEVSIRGVPERYSHGQLKSYAFRDKVSGKRIYAFWLAVYCDPADRFQPIAAELTVRDAGVRMPVLIDLRTGGVAPLEWKDKDRTTVAVPLKDSVMAVADASYLDWAEVPEAPAELKAEARAGSLHLRWKAGGDARIEVQRSENFGPWKAVKELPAASTGFEEPAPVKGYVTYRVRAIGKEGPSAWSNPAWVGNQLH